MAILSQCDNFRTPEKQVFHTQCTVQQTDVLRFLEFRGGVTCITLDVGTKIDEEVSARNSLAPGSALVCAKTGCADHIDLTLWWTSKRWWDKH